MLRLLQQLWQVETSYADLIPLEHYLVIQRSNKERDIQFVYLEESKLDFPKPDSFRS